MKLNIINIHKTKIGERELPEQFNEPYRPDLIKLAVLAIQSNRRQRFGAMPGAGTRASAKLSRRRRDYKTSYGLGISRVPRKILSRRGTRMNWVGAFAPGMVGGRRSHPPKAEKSFFKKINLKERKKAIKSALTASLNPEIIKQRGHKIPVEFPFIVEESMETVSKTKELIQILNKLGFQPELERLSTKRIRSGKGKFRGRKHRNPIGPLFIVSKQCKLIDAASNIQGIDVAVVDKINAEMLAPGTIAGRPILITTPALSRFENEKIYTENQTLKRELKQEKTQKPVAEKKTNKSEAKKPAIKKIKQVQKD